MKTKTVVLLRGGIDSTVCLAQAVDELGAENVVALNLYYGQLHGKDVKLTKAIADHYGVKHVELDISEAMSFSSSISLEANKVTIEERVKNDAATEIPFRNGLMISVAASVAMGMRADTVRYAVHKDEAAGQFYPDCQESFFKAMAAAIDTGTGGKLRLELPFIDMTKKDVMEIGMKLSVPFEKTWSCFVNSDKPCGACTNCIGRAKAFELIGMKDPLLG